MPLTLNIGVSKKVGLPEFSSVGASCNLELELDAMLIRNDLDGLHEQIRGAFVAARQAVDDELARYQAQDGPRAPIQPVTTSANDHHNGRETPGNGSLPRSNGTPVRADRPRGRTAKPATAGQGILGTGAASGWATLGIGSVVFLIVDQIVSWVW